MKLIPSNRAPTLFDCQLLVHVRRQHAVVHVVVVVVAFLLLHRDLAQPLNGPAADAARDDGAHREAVVDCQPAPVLWLQEGKGGGREELAFFPFSSSL